MAAIQDQAGRAIHVAQGIEHGPRDDFLKELHSHIPHASTFIANSGAEAVECAMKLAAAGGREKFVALEGGFHGRTLGALSLTHKEGYRGPFAHVLQDVTFIPPTVEALDAVDRETAALVLEPVQGEGGIHPLPDAFLHAARDAATDKGALLIHDEIQSSIRTGMFLHGGADIVTMGKGLAGGLPIGTCSVSAEVAERLPRAGHGSTYGGSPLVCAAGAETIRTLYDERLMDRARTIGPAFAKALAEAPVVKSVRSQGMMIGVDVRTRPAPVLRALEGAGFLVLAGPKGFRLLPPLTTPQAQLDQFAEVLCAI